MTCNDIRELMPDLAAGLSAATPEMDEHILSCSECERTLNAMRQTMTVLDEWQVPEPSPYFDVRLHARLREEMARRPVSWLEWLRKPALAVSLTVLMVMSVTLFRFNNGKVETKSESHPIVASNQLGSATQASLAEPGSAVGDLQMLDKNHDLYSDFDVLDDLQVQDGNANP
jgi:predicted anti-sigma-YlaC factor YlaD